jgi:hypothetical protein
MKPLPVITAATEAAALDPAIRAALEAVNGRACRFAITEPRVVRKALRVGTVVVFTPASAAQRHAMRAYSVAQEG